MHRSQRQGGYTITELMVTMAIMTIVMAIAMRFMGDSIKVVQVTQEMTEAQQGLRTAQEFIVRDLKGAGDGMDDIVVPRMLTNFLNNYITKSPVDDASDATGVLGVLGVITSDDDPPAGTAVPVPSPAPGTTTPILADTDRLTVMKLDTSPQTCLNPPICYISLPSGAVTANGQTVTVPTGPAMSQFSIGDIYFFTAYGGGSAFGSVTAVNAGARTLTFAAGDRFGLNRVAANGPIYLAANGKASTLMRMQIIHYYIDKENLLRRRVYGIGSVGGYTDTTVAEHVTDLQFRYILNQSAANGSVVAPVEELGTEEKLGQIRQVEVTIKTETAHDVVVKDGEPAKQELSMTSTTAVRNMQFNKALKMKTN